MTLRELIGAPPIGAPITGRDRKRIGELISELVPEPARKWFLDAFANPRDMTIGGINRYLEIDVDRNFNTLFDCCFYWSDVPNPIAPSWSRIFESKPRSIDTVSRNILRGSFRPVTEVSRKVQL